MTVPSLSGDVRVVVPPGTSHGKVLKVAGKGISINGGPLGDQFVSLGIRVLKDPPECVRELLENLRDLEDQVSRPGQSSC